MKQAYELTVPLADGTVTRETLDALAGEFHAQHLRTYGHENPNESVQMVNVRVTATGRMPRVEFHAGAAGTEGERTVGDCGAIAGEDSGVEREVWFGEPIPCPVISRHDLGPRPGRSGAETPAGAGGAVDSGISAGIHTARPGPFILEEMDCTVVVPPGWSAALDERGSIAMSRSG